MNDAEPDLTRLLQDGAWLRRFVRTLVPAQEVDDVVQTTALAALQQKAPVEHPRGWLRGIAANFARMVHRRQHRHARALANVPHTAASAPTADLVAGLEVQQAISEALLALPEPTRTILVLRYQEQLDCAAIAARVGLQEAAVRQRLHRGREMVRSRLQQRFGRDWRTCGAVLAFAGRPRELAPTAMAASTKFAAAFVLVGGLTGAGWASTRLPEPGLPTSAPASSLAIAAMQASPLPSVDMVSERTLVADVVQDPVKAIPASPITVRGRLVAAEDGRALTGVSLTPDFRFRSEDAKQGEPKPEALTTDADGRFTVQCPSTAISVEVGFRAKDRCSRWYEASPPHTIDLGDIPLTNGGTLRGVLLDEAGRPMEGVWLGLPIDGGFPTARKISFPAKTAADGSFSWKAPAPPGKLEVMCDSPGVTLLESTANIVAGTANAAVLRGRRLTAIRGVVFGVDGAPVAGVELEAIDPTAKNQTRCCGMARSAADGSFELFRREEGPDAVALRTHLIRGAHDLTTEPIRCAFGDSGIRVVVTPRIPVRLQVIDQDTKAPIERFYWGADRMRHNGACCIGGSVAFLEGGRLVFEGLAADVRIRLCAPDPMLAPVHLVVTESMRTATSIPVELPRLRSFPLELIDARGHAVTTEFHVVDRCGASQPELWSDPHAGMNCTTSTAFLVSSATTDATGRATLLAPDDRRDLVVALKRNGRDVWLPLILPKAGQPIRLVVPD